MSLFKNTFVKIELNLTCFVHTFGHHQRFFFKIHFYQILGKGYVTLQCISSLSKIIKKLLLPLRSLRPVIKRTVTL
jgi:hypothetical protein